MNRLPQHTAETLGLIQAATANPEALVSDSYGQYAVLRKGVLYILYRTTDSYYAVLRSSKPDTATYYENYQKAVKGIEWLALHPSVGVDETIE